MTTGLTLDDLGAKVDQLSTKLDDLVPAQRTSAAQVVVSSNGLADISNNLGTMIAGEFRAGNGEQPGQGFSGSRIAWPALTYNAAPWNIVGVNADVLQFGVNALTGQLVAGGGAVTLDTNGLSILGNSAGSVTPNAVSWNQTTGDGGHLLADIYAFYNTGTATETLNILADGTPSSYLANIVLKATSNSAAQSTLSAVGSSSVTASIGVVVSGTTPYMDLTTTHDHGGVIRQHSDSFEWHSGALDPTIASLDGSGNLNINGLIASGSATIDGGLNLGTETGAGTGQIMMSGSLNIDNAQPLNWKDNGGTARPIVILTAANNLEIGSGSNYGGAMILHSGKSGGSIVWKDSSGVTQMTIDEAGNINPNGYIEPGSSSRHIKSYEYSNIPNGTSQQLVSDIAAPFGVIFIEDITDGAMAIFLVTGSAHTSKLIGNQGGAWSATLGTAGDDNVAWDGSSKFVIQNNRGGTRSYWVMHFGAS